MDCGLVRRSLVAVGGPRRVARTHEDPRQRHRAALHQRRQRRARDPAARWAGRLPLVGTTDAPRSRATTTSSRTAGATTIPNQNPQTATDHSAIVEAADLAALIKALRLKRVNLVGTSMGAATALTLAVDHPAWFAAWCSPSHRFWRGRSDFADGGALYRRFHAAHPDPGARGVCRRRRRGRDAVLRRRLRLARALRLAAARSACSASCRTPDSSR